VTLIFREKQKPQNEFEAWCTSSLEVLNAEVDIPTFMAFLNDIESPYEVGKILHPYDVSLIFSRNLTIFF
jgi:hypothetical protein